jgi:hypothetical protein
MSHPILRLGDQITVAPIVHGSGDFAWEVRRLILSQPFDCVAVPLPPSFQPLVERAILDLPRPSAVVQRDYPDFAVESGPPAEWESLVHGAFDEDSGAPGASYVPIDPCQGVIAAIRTALGEHIPRRFIDLETSRFVSISHAFPDPYALKKVTLEQYAAAVVPFLQPPPVPQWKERVEHMSARLRHLTGRFKNILLVCGILEWPWIRQAFLAEPMSSTEDQPALEPECYPVETATLYFMLGELPFVTGLYEQARETLDDDEHLSIDSVKELLLSARESYRAEYRSRARRITPKLLTTCLKYTRNLTLLERHLTPQLTTIVTAAQQTAGNGYALHVLETAKSYPYSSPGGSRIRFGIGRATLPGGDTLRMVSRLPGPPIIWKSLQLIPKPDERQAKEWKQKWNPFSQCSWPPEDELIENFRAAVFDRARQILGQDLARTEKFTTSVKDGIDIRDTLRHWHEREIYVKVLPPNRDKLDAVVMLFDSPADPRDYRWRATWYAEHAEESTLAFFATDFRQQPVGPGICLANYGGALFLFPPVPILDIWSDKRLEFAETLEERLIAAACLHSRAPHVALLSAFPPGTAWKAIARQRRRQLVHVPLGQFSDETVQRLRMVHVLNGKKVRSYAAEYIRNA